MKCNVTYLKVVALDEGYARIRVLLRNQRMEEEADKTVQGWDGTPRKQYEYQHPREAYLTVDEALDMLPRLEGTASFYPYYTDVSHIWRAGDQGLTEVYLSSANDGLHGRYEQFDFVFPGAELAKLLRLAIAYANRNEAWEEEVAQEALATITARYWPRFVTQYWPNEEAFWTDVNDVRQHDLAACLTGLQQIAENYSDGQPSTIQLSRHTAHGDASLPGEWAFTILSPDGKRIINGGLYPHSEEEDGVTVYRYSTHT